MADLFALDGKVALVTGGSRGIGAMIARGFVEAGVRTYISSRKAGPCDAMAAELSEIGWCQSIPADLSTEAACIELAAAISEREDALDILVNNAGATWGAPIAEFDDAAWDKVLSINVKGVFHLTKALLPLLEAAGSQEVPARVINIGSIDGIHVPILETYSYSASKAAVHQLTRHLARRLAPTITVNAIAPGYVDTEMVRAVPPDVLEKIVSRIPMGRLGHAEDIARGVVFLTAEEGDFITGSTLSINGGQHMY